MSGQEMVSNSFYDTNLNMEWCTNNNDLSFPFSTVFSILGECLSFSSSWASYLSLPERVTAPLF
jgi:hypothetical protein